MVTGGEEGQRPTVEEVTNAMAQRGMSFRFLPGEPVTLRSMAAKALRLALQGGPRPQIVGQA